MTIDDIADEIISDLDLNERLRLANLPGSELETVEILLPLYTSGILRADNSYGHIEKYALGETEAMEIVKSVWERLRETHHLRGVI